jgi:uncharacterized membrane protein
MSQNSQNHIDRLAKAVHWTLLIGLVASGLLFIAGLLVVVVKNQPRPEGPPPAISVLFPLALTGDGVALLNLGFLTLMLTPLARVLILGIGWGTERNWHFAAIAFIVLGLLSISLVIGVG